LIFCKTTYNLLLHPLRSYPGPMLGRASRLYYIYYQFRGDLPFMTKALHEKYGSVVRIAPDELSYSSGDAWHDIYGCFTFHYTLLKVISVKNIKAVSNLCASADHKRFRRVMGPAFSEKTVKAQEYLMKRHVDLFISQVSQGSLLIVVVMN
ncbi:hypothetical protein COCCADRAFT_93226, partial [Bipolaris zeicola 26-R-13]